MNVTYEMIEGKIKEYKMHNRAEDFFFLVDVLNQLKADGVTGELVNRLAFIVCMG